MSYLVLARKYRPQTFDEVVGQAHVTHTLSNAISSDRVAHAIMFSGPRGTGKTTVARILAKAMNCLEGPVPEPCNQCRSCREIRAGSSVDVYEIDGASNNSVDQVRELRENVRYTPIHSRYKIYIIDEVHMLSIAAFNALLKTLEEPPAHILFMFATTEPQKIPITILSRCQRHELRRIDLPSIQKQMEELCSKEKIQLPVESLWMMAREAGGSMRDALSLLDLVITCGEGATASDQITDLLGVVDRKVIFDISDAILSADIPAVLDLLDVVYERGYDMKKLYSDLVEHFRNMLVVKMGQKIRNLVNLPAHEIERIKDQVKETSAIFLHQQFGSLLEEEVGLRFSAQPKLVLEMAFLKMCRIKPALSMDVLIEKLDLLKDAVGSPPLSDMHPQKADTVPDDPPSPEVVTDPVVPSDTEPALASTIAIEDPEDLWKRLLDISSEKYPMLAATLEKCALNSLGRQEIEILVNGSDFNLRMLQRTKNQEILQKLLKNLLGKSMRIRFISKTGTGSTNQEKKKHENQLKQQALSHPLVAETVEIFNGKVVDVKILQEES
jgi:DNA polymerase III subunit gamma/tau